MWPDPASKKVWQVPRKMRINFDSSLVGDSCGERRPFPLVCTLIYSQILRELMTVRLQLMSSGYVGELTSAPSATYALRASRGNGLNPARYVQMHSRMATCTLLLMPWLASSHACLEGPPQSSG